MADSYLIFRNASGVKYAQVDNFDWLTARLAVNKIDRLKFQLPGEHPVLDSLADRDQIEFWRRDPERGLDFYRHFSGLYRAIKQTRPSANRTVITALGDKSLLARRIVAWAAGTANRSAFVSVAAETIMKALVAYNITVNATTGNGRLADGTPWPAPYITVDVEVASQSPSASMSRSVSPSASISPSPSLSPSGSASPSASASSSVSRSASPSGSQSPSASTSASASASKSISPSASSSPSGSASPSSSVSSSPSLSLSPSSSASLSASASASASSSASQSPSASTSRSASASQSPSASTSASSSASLSPSGSQSPSSSASLSESASLSASASSSASISQSRSLSPSASLSPSRSASRSASASLSPSRSLSPSASPSASTEAGNVVDWYCSNDNLLETLQKLALIAGGDFDLEKSDLNSESLVWDFRFYPGQLGVDRSSTLIFSVLRGNMIDPVFELSREEEATLAIVGGQGQGSDRDYLTRQGTNYGANNHIEMFVDSHADTTAGRQAAGDKRLVDREAFELFDFGIQQTQGCVYRRHFGLGDLAKAVNPFTGTSSTVKIMAVNLSLDAGGAETITGEVQAT